MITTTIRVAEGAKVNVEAHVPCVIRHTSGDRNVSVGLLGEGVIVITPDRGSMPATTSVLVVSDVDVHTLGYESTAMRAVKAGDSYQWQIFEKAPFWKNLGSELVGV